jgi:hypothetical protein
MDRNDMSHLTHLLPAILAVFSLSLTVPDVADDSGRTLFDFAKPDAAQAWQPVNDGVMGGVSDGRFKITDQGTMEVKDFRRARSRGRMDSFLARSLTSRVEVRPC